MYDPRSMHWVANIAYAVGALLYLPILLYQMIVQGKNRRGWKQRLGFVPTFDDTRPRIWLHAVSLGEINATPKLIEAIKKRRPEFDIVVSTTTDTGFARAVQLYGEHHVFRFPLDLSPIVGRVLARINPSLILLVELEVWYNLVRMAKARGIPVAVVNGRLTERSARRFGRIGGLIKPMFANLAWVGAQNETIAGRFRSLGTPADHVEVTSSLKWDSAYVADAVDGSEALAAAMGIDRSRPLWVCGSTGPGEEQMILGALGSLLRERPVAKTGVDRDSATNVHATEPILVLVPRKPERFDEVARLITQARFRCVRRSECADGSRIDPVAGRTVLLGDTMGELRKFYALADVVFVGRTLVPLGGSDPMEVAALGKPIIVGPFSDNFRDPVDALERADAVCVVDDADALAAAVAVLLDDPEGSRRCGLRGRQVVIDNQGATVRTVDAVLRVFDEGRVVADSQATDPRDQPALHRDRSS